MATCKAPDCGKTFTREKINGQNDISVTWCSIDCGLRLARHRQDAAHERAAGKARRDKLKREQMARKDVRELNQRTRSWQLDKTQTAFNRMRLLEERLWFKERNRPVECISCQGKNLKWNAGHFISRGASANLRFSPMNVFVQCAWNCNSQKSSNRDGYEKGLVLRFGEKAGQGIIDYCKASYSTPRKYECDELEEMRAGFAARARKLEKELAE